MQLPDEAERKRQIRKSLDSVLQGNDVVSHLAEVRRAALDGRPCVGGEQFTEGCLRAFDPARQDRLAAYEGAHQ